MTQKVVTIHGISSDGAWQDEVAKILEPHFDCVSIRYPQYRRLAPIKVAPWLVGVPAAIGLGLAVGVSAWITGVIGLTLSAAYCVIVRSNARKTVMSRWLEKVGNPHPRPHLIAHSLGTILSLDLIKHVPALLRRLLRGATTEQIMQELGVTSRNAVYLRISRLRGKLQSLLLDP